MVEFYPRSEWASRKPTFRQLHIPTAEAWMHHTGIRLHGSVPTVPGREAVINWARNFEEAEIKHDPDLIAIAYHRLIISSGPHDGAIVETRPFGTQGGATGGRNSVSHAICITGNFSDGDTPSPAALDSAASEWAKAIKGGFVSYAAFINSHSNAPGNSTACCGSTLIARLPNLRDLVQKKLHSPSTSPTPPAVPNPSPVPPVIRLGSKGPVVTLWQTYLRDYAGQNIAVDGIFGPQTNLATKNFQRFCKLRPIDGIVGPITWGMMDYVVRHR